jgi:DNA mismatch repair protein MutL
MNVVARSACIAAVKAHDRLTFQEARSLLHQMSACELPFSCPHGRPTIINISLKELEKRFGRK